MSASRRCAECLRATRLPALLDPSLSCRTSRKLSTFPTHKQAPFISLPFSGGSRLVLLWTFKYGGVSNAVHDCHVRERSPIVDSHTTRNAPDSVGVSTR